MTTNHGFAGFRQLLASHRATARTMLPLLAGLAFAVTTSARGEVYKWTDENDVVHYSSAPPQKNKAKFKRIDSKDLLVSQAKSPQHAALPPPAEQATQDLNDKVDALQHQVEAERQARQTADAQNQATQAAYAQALANQQAVAGYVPTIPSVSGILFVPPPHRIHDGSCRGVGTNTMNCSSHPGHWQQPPQPQVRSH